MKWLVIGAGGIADRRSIPAIVSHPENELVAVMDRVPEVAEKMGKKYGCRFYTDEEEMLRSEQSDAVYIGTPVMCHKGQAELCLRYHRHVFMEKPIAMTGPDAVELVAAFRKAGLQITIGYMMGYHNLHRKAKEIVAGGGVGQVVDVRAQFGCWYPDIPGAWRQKKALGGGGAIMDLGVHCFELIETVLDDEITDTKAFFHTATFSYEVEDCGVIAFKTRKKALGHVDVNFNIPDTAVSSKFEIYGTEGAIILTNTLSQEESGRLEYIHSPQGAYDAQQSRSRDEAQCFEGENGNLYLKQVNAFVDIVKSGKPDYSNAEKAVHIQKLIDNIYNEE